jgi:hypothetical protein
MKVGLNKARTVFLHRGLRTKKINAKLLIHRRHGWVIFLLDGGVQLGNASGRAKALP